MYSFLHQLFQQESLNDNRIFVRYNFLRCIRQPNPIEFQWHGLLQMGTQDTSKELYLRFCVVESGKITF